MPFWLVWFLAGVTATSVAVAASNPNMFPSGNAGVPQAPIEHSQQ
jgi:hypothetical protein